MAGRTTSMDSMVYLDASYAIALAVKRERHHAAALEVTGELRAEGTRVVTTRTVIMEIGNYLSAPRYRESVIRYLRQLERDVAVKILPLTEDLFQEGFALYRQRPDKAWGLTGLCFLRRHASARFARSAHGRSALRAGRVQSAASLVRRRTCPPSAAFLLCATLLLLPSSVMAEATAPLTRSLALDVLADRLRAHFGERLDALYALPDDPYEPQGDPDVLHVLAVFPDEGYDRSDVQSEIIDVGVAFDREVDFRFFAMPKVASATDVRRGTTGAARAAEGGVLL